MASPTKRTRDISTILFLILSTNVTIFGLPLAATDGENTDGEIAQPNGQMFPDGMPPPPPGAFNDPGVLPSNELPESSPGDAVPPSGGDSPVEAAEVPGTGLAMMAGPVVPSGNTGDMFPGNMPAPPPGAVNDEVSQTGLVVPPSNGNMFPDNMPAPPPGAVNDEVPQTGLVVPPGNGNMFPDNMPAPPPGAVNDEMPQTGHAIPPSNGDMFPDNMPAPPPGAVNDEVPQTGLVVPPSNGDMFPDNMPAPPPGAVNDEEPQTGQAVPPSNGNMFPDNMPAPPPGAVNDGIAPLAEQEIAPREDDVNQENPAILNKETVTPNRGMFPPNMPPPPPGAFNEPPPVPKFSEEKPNKQTAQLDGTVVEPVYAAGMNVPNAAAVPPSDQNPFIDPIQGPFASNKQDIATANEPSNVLPYNPDNPVPSNQNTQYGQTSGDPQEFVPNTQDNLEEVQAPYNPNDLDGVNNAVPSQNNPPAESAPNQNEASAPIYSNIPDTNPNPTAELISNQNLPTDPVDTDQSETSYDSSYESSYEEVSYDENENPEESSPESTFSEEGSYSSWEESESESDYSFLNFLESSADTIMDSSDSESSDSFTGNEQDFNSLWEDSESEDLAEYDSANLEESSEYSDLGWLFGSDGGSYMGAEGETSEEEEEGYFEDNMEEENDGHDVDQQPPIPDGVFDAMEREDDLYRTGGTRLIIYCIPAIILSVLVILAWKNYRGKIRVVGVPSVDAKQYDWKSDRTSEEHAPMLLDQDQEERGY